jgi:hypothetical protein
VNWAERDDGEVAEVGGGFSNVVEDDVDEEAGAVALAVADPAGSWCFNDDLSGKAVVADGR